MLQYSFHMYPFMFLNITARQCRPVYGEANKCCKCHIELILACVEKTHCITNVSLATVVGVSLRSNTMGTEVDTNGQIRSPKETSKHGTRLLAADQTWEDCNPA